MKVMILAAGRGQRMRPLTDRTPKPMLKVRGVPLIVHLIQRLATAGIRDIVVNHAHLGGVIESGLGTGESWGVRIRYSPEPEALETAGGIANALKLLGPAPFMAVNGDIFCDFDFSRLIRRDLRDDLAHLVLVPNPSHHPRGDFRLTDERVTRVMAPCGSDDSGNFTFAGIGLYDPALFSGLAVGKPARLAPLLLAAMDAQRVSGELHSGLWHDVGTPQRLAELEGMS